MGSKDNWEIIGYIEYPGDNAAQIADEINNLKVWKKANEDVLTSKLNASLQAQQAQEETEKPFRRGAVHNPRRFKGNFEGL